MGLTSKTGFIVSTRSHGILLRLAQYIIKMSINFKQKAVNILL